MGKVRKNFKIITRISIVLIAILLIQILGTIDGNKKIISVSNAETFGDFEYEVDKKSNVTITKYKGSATEVIIPETIDEKTVTSIGYNAFFKCSSLTSIEIPSGVTSIMGYYAFYGCSSLTNIKVSENNKKYMSEDGVLFNKDKTEIIKYPEGKIDILEYKIPSEVTSIVEYAFWDCRSLTHIEIPSGVTSIGKAAFVGCSSLTSIEIPGGVTSIGEDAFSYCSSLISIEIPSGVTNIASRLFYECSSLTSIEIPGGVTSIGNWAFRKCSSLTSIEIPGGVTSIGEDAFYECSSLTSINVSKNNKKYMSEGGVLFNIDKSEIIKYPGGKIDVLEYKIPSGVTSIGELAFVGCNSLTSIEIPSGVTSIGDGAFARCSSLTSIQIPEGVQKIGVSLFADSISLKSIEIPGGVTSIESYAFYGCSSLTSIKIPSGVTSIGDQAFRKCKSLTSIEIPSGVTSIGAYAFMECSSLTSIEIPSEVTSIGDEVFYGCELYVASNSNEIEVPEIIQRAKKEGDILYSDAEFDLYNCTLSSDNKKIIINNYSGENSVAHISIKSGKLKGLQLNVVKPGKIIYNIFDGYTWTNTNVTATVILEKDDKITNNNGNKSYIFQKNGEFTFEYTTSNGQNKTAKAQVNNIDKDAPVINKVTGNEKEWTNKDVTLTIDAKDDLSGLAEEAYSFDGGVSWQAENTKKYTETTTGIVVKVKDKVGNVETYKAIDIKIDKDKPVINSVKGNPTNWTNKDVTLTIDAKDELSGLAEKAYSFDGGVSWQADNTKKYTDSATGVVVQVKDNAGNIEKYEAIDIKIDKEKPVINSVKGNPTNWTNKDVTLTVDAKDDQSGLAEKAYSFDGGVSWQADNKKTYTKNTSGIAVQVKDNVGNIVAYETINITKIDKEGPQVTIKTEKESEDNKLKVILTANEAIKNTEELKLSNIKNIESWQLSEDEKELTIIYVNNTEENIKITDKFIIKDQLGNESTVDLEKENITIQAKKKSEEKDDEDNKVTLTDLTVKSKPNKTEYVAGEKFNIAGMVIVAKYSNGTSKTITNYTYEPKGNLSESDKEIKITYKEGDITKNVTVAIKVNKAENTQEEKGNGTTDNTGSKTENGTTDNTGSKTENGTTDNTGSKTENGTTDNTGSKTENGTTDNTGSKTENGTTDNTGSKTENGATDSTGIKTGNGITNNSGTQNLETKIKTIKSDSTDAKQSSEVSASENKAGAILPKTGVSRIIILSSIVVLIAIAVMILKKYKSLNI